MPFWRQGDNADPSQVPAGTHVERPAAPDHHEVSSESLGTASSDRRPSSPNSSPTPGSWSPSEILGSTPLAEPDPQPPAASASMGSESTTGEQDAPAAAPEPAGAPAATDVGEGSGGVPPGADDGAASPGLPTTRGASGSPAEPSDPDEPSSTDELVPDEVPDGPIASGPIVPEPGAASVTLPTGASPPVVEPTPTIPPRPLPRVIALANQKGGVGKTTTTINLGAALAEDDHRVLIIDLDPQGNATTGLGINARALEHSIYDVLLNEVPIEDCIESTSVLNLFVAPASLDLAGAEIELVPVMSREMRLRNAINQVKGDYDYILIDCPPSLGLLTVNALAAADEVMVPIQCEYYALEGLGQLIRNINLVQRNLNTALILGSIVLVMYDGRTKLAEQVAGEVREHFGELVCRNVIPRNIRLSEAPSYGLPITSFDGSSRGAVAYRELAREVHSVSA